MAIKVLEIRYVLLEWTEGEDRGAHSILPLDCVRNFSVTDFFERTDKTEKLVEWRKGRQPWPVHRARIIDVAKLEKTLQIKLMEMEKEGTQWQIKRPHIPNSKYSEQQGQTEKASKKKVDNKKGGASKYKHQEGEKQEEGHDRLSKNKIDVKKRWSSKYNHEEEEEKAEEEEEEEDDEARHDRPSKNKRASEEEECIGDKEDITAAEFRKHLDEQMWERRKLNQMQINLQEMRNEVHSLKNENARLKDIIINQIPQMKSDLAIIAQKIEVIKGSGVFCQAEAWKAARLANSATAMVRNLLLGTFDLETLLKSNLNGGKPSRGDGEQLVALDKIKKAAIIGINGDCKRCYIEEVAGSQPRADRHIY
ncbi:hypothetical protein Q7C36_005188 [Tachysurus vachellii]|uniref:Uncharacterized protein n=1 Tax=Tachysurus vachellii TaxID=175792 RepID=A0AA88NY32_TACVA|nr:hypothetical protein Q7C36_005188 [Tachysurus vachellii]